MKQFTQRTVVRTVFVLVILLAGIAMVPYIDRPVEALEWRSLAGVYAPELIVHEAEGAPGSAFAFTGSGYPANSVGRLFANGRYLGRVRVDGSGSAQFIIQSPAGMHSGQFDITMEVGANASATHSFMLSQSASIVMPPTGFTGPVFNVQTNRFSPR